MDLSTMKRAASFGLRHLQTAAEGTECMTKQQRNDLLLAAAMLKAAPDLINNVGTLCGSVEAGDASDQPQAALMRCAERLRRAVAIGTDRKQGELLT